MKAKHILPVLVAAVAWVTTSCSTNPKHISAADFQRHFEWRNLQTMHAYSYLGETNGAVYMLYQKAPLVGSKWKKQILFTETNGLAPGFLEHMRSVSRLERDGAANRNQPIRPETNSTSSAAGSHR